jgi:TolA-binding protein/peroxiredoxin
MLLALLVTMTMPGCKDSSSPEKSVREPEKSARVPENPIGEHFKALFKDDPESQKEFQRIQEEFRTGKRSLAIQDLNALLQRSPQAPWVEAVEFYLAQVWTALQKYGNALQQLEALLNRYPNSPAVPRFLVSQGQIFLTLGKQRRVLDPEDPVGTKYLQQAEAIFHKASKNVSGNRDMSAEILFYVGETSSSLGDGARAKEALRKVAEAYGDTSFGSKALYSLAGVYLRAADLEGAEKAFMEITDRYPKTRLARKAGKKLEGLGLVGSSAPPLQIKEWIGEAPPEGDIYRGKVTLLSFWAIWCPHCKRNIPKMERLLESYREKGVSVVGVTRERDAQGADEVREFVESHPMGYPTGIDDDGKTSKGMAVDSIPCVIAVDTQGRIRWHGHPDYLSDEVIQGLLGPNA